MATLTGYVAKHADAQEWLDKADRLYVLADRSMSSQPDRRLLTNALMAAWDFIGEVPTAEDDAPSLYAKADASFLRADPGTVPNASEDLLINALMDAWDLIGALSSRPFNSN